MQCEVFMVNAFCHDGQGGNGAGVVLDCLPLSDAQCLDIAARMGFSETVFVAESPRADFRLSYFTPVAEVDLCGHATIATFALLHERGLAPGTYSIDTRSGLLSVEVGTDGLVFMQQCLPRFFEQYAAADFAQCLPVEYCHPGLPIQAVSTGLKDVLFPVDSVEHLRALRPNFHAMAALNKAQGVVGVHAFALTADDSAECRNFAPLYGIDEESATGTSNCALACYLHRHVGPRDRYSFLQGVTMRQPSDIEVLVDSDSSGIRRVMVGGRGVVLGSRLLSVS